MSQTSRARPASEADLVGGPPPAGALPRLLATAGNPDLDSHYRAWGPLPPGRPALVEEVAAAGLRGRGGGSFPTYRKLQSVGSGRRRPIVVANGMEAEPVSLKDKTLLANAPHLVLDGISVAAETVGALEAILCIDRGFPATAAILASALDERRRAGADRVPIAVHQGPSRYLAGEESALIHWLNGGEARPTFVPPRPFEKGVGGRPTLVNNVETLANLALVARFGAAWYRSLGTTNDPGTALVTIVGEVATPGVFEVPYGTPVGQVLGSAGGGPSGGWVLVGGYSGAWLTTEQAARLTFDRSGLSRGGAVVGCASLLVVDRRSCGLAAAAAVTAWLADQNAGQCGPCINGLPSIAAAMKGLLVGDRQRRWERQLHRWLEMVEGRGACHHPDGVVRMVRSALVTFAGEIAEHRNHDKGGCQGRVPKLPLPHPEEESWR